jgi:hypothetical protein
MKLLDVVQQVGALDDELTIYARHPWRPTSDVQLAIEGSKEEAAAKDVGLSYFVEVFIARDFLEDWRAGMERTPTVEQSCERLIEYAMNDA